MHLNTFLTLSTETKECSFGRRTRLLEQLAGGRFRLQRHDANARAVFGMVRHCRGHQCRAYSLEYGKIGSRYHTPAPLQAEIHEPQATLLATLGQPIFEPLTNAPTAKGAPELFYCRGSGADGVGEYTSEGFVVLKGSRGRLENVASIRGTSSERFRGKLLKEGVLNIDGGGVILTRDYLFSSPSMAATALQGRSANG